MRLQCDNKSSKRLELPLFLQARHLLLILGELLAQVVQVLYPLLLELVVVEVGQLSVFLLLLLAAAAPGLVGGGLLGVCYLALFPGQV